MDIELIEREEELALLIARVRSRRLVTVTGPGGVGKTALANRAAVDIAGDFTLGSILIDLTRIDQPDGVPEAIARQLGFSDFRSVLNAPSDRRPGLVVFDNCEHVLEAAADAVSRLLDAGSSQTVLATSRSPLDVSGESVLTLSPLTVPSKDLDDDAGALRLFRRRSEDNDATIDRTDEATAAEICRRLDGIPLAIEIAAARLRSRSVSELAQELESRPHALARPRFRGNPHHRSIADMVSLSTDNLTDTQRTFFHRLGVFHGPFTAGMAAAVALPREPGDGDDGQPTLELAVDELDRLVNAALVVANTSGRTSWYRLLQPIRAVAVQGLERAGQRTRIESRWIDHLLELVSDIVARAIEGWDHTLLAELLELYVNLAAALRWLLANEADDRSDRALAILMVLWGVVHQSHTAEVAELGEAVLDRWPDPAAPLWADGAATVSTCRGLLGDNEGAIELAKIGLDHVEGSFLAPASLRRAVAYAQRAAGDLPSALATLGQAAAAADQVGMPSMANELRVDEGYLRSVLEDYAVGLGAIDAALDQAVKTPGMTINVGWARAIKGVAVLQHGAEDAVPLLEEAYRTSRDIDYRAGTTYSLRGLALANVDAGRIGPAAAAVLTLLDGLAGAGGLSDLRLGLEAGACVLHDAEDDRWIPVAAAAQALPLTTLRTRVELSRLDADRSTVDVPSGPEAFRLCRDAMRELADADTSAGRTADPTATNGHDRTPSAAVLRRDGDVWRIEFRGGTTTVRAGKGIADLATLLAAPGREFAAVDLATADIVDGAGDELIDAAARRNYEERIRLLQEDLEEAERNNDSGRVERLTVELDALVEHLTASVGLGGRNRRSGGTAERARSAVTQRIRATIRKLETELPELGHHLRISISTGSYCCYRPAVPTVWDVQR